MLQDRYESIGMDEKLHDLVELFKKSEKNIFAVHDAKGKFAGIIELNDVKQQLFQAERYDSLPIHALMKRPSAVLYEDQDMHEVMEKFDLTQSWYLPVLTKDKIFTGFISKTKVFNKYREILSTQTDFYDEA